MSNPKNRRIRVMTTASIVSFSLTLLGASFAVLSGTIPLAVSTSERTDLGTLLFVAPLVVLVLALVFEASRIALRTAPLPEPRLVRVARWTDGDASFPR